MGKKKKMEEEGEEDGREGEEEGRDLRVCVGQKMDGLGAAPGSRMGGEMEGQRQPAR